MTIRAAILAVACLSLAACQTSAPAPPSIAHPGAHAAGAGNAAQGLAYAQQYCSGCHSVAPGETISPNFEAPAFAVVANQPGMTSTALNAWLHGPHENMPNVAVDPNHFDDLVAYLASLKHR